MLSVLLGRFKSLTLQQMEECFDSITMCFTKRLGALISSIVTGTAAFVKQAN